MQKELQRCLKCQLITVRHLAAGCNQQAACSTCGKDHCTLECSETDRAAFWCINCKEKGHALWDRLCPAFLAASKRLEDTDPKHTYKYFPNQDEWTWEEQLGFEHLGPPSRHGPMSGRDHGNVRQDNENGWQQARGENRDRDNGWTTRVNAHDTGAEGNEGEKMMVRAPSRQRRIDDFPITAPRAYQTATRPTWPHESIRHNKLGKSRS